MKKLKKLIKIPKFFIVRLKNTDLIKNKMREREWDSSFHSEWQKRNVIASNRSLRGNLIICYYGTLLMFFINQYFGENMRFLNEGFQPSFEMTQKMISPVEMANT